MKLNKVYYAFISFIIITLGFFIYLHNNNISTSPNIKPTNTDISRYDGIDINFTSLDSETYKISRHYPYFNNKTLDGLITNYIDRIEKEFLNEIDSLDQDFLKEYPAHLYITFEIHKLNNNIYSFVFTQEHHYSKANPYQKNDVFIVDISSNKQLTTKSSPFWKDDTLDTLYSLIKKKFEASALYSDYFFSDMFETWFYNPLNDFSNVYFDKDRVVFKFDKYEVTAGVAGAPEIFINVSELNNILSDYWINLISENQNFEQETTAVIIEFDTEATTEATSDLPVETNPEQTTDKNSAITKKKIAITFDDGPHKDFTIQILDLFDKYNGKATFYMLGSRVDFYPHIAKNVIERGHEIGNHTWNHKDLTKLDTSSLLDEINRTNSAIKKSTGILPKTLRPPFGEINEQTKKIIDEKVVLWDVDTLDWSSHDPDEILSIIKRDVRENSIILLHDIHKSTLDALPAILEYLYNNNYEFVTISNLLGY